MSHHPGHDEDVAGADDLTRIAGIGAKTAERLNAAGIRHYADLASRSAGDIVVLLSDVAGLSPARIDGWRAQAGELAAGTAAGPAHDIPEGSVPDGSGDAPSDGQHYESFVVRVLLNEDGSIRRTTAQHVGTGVERHWPGPEREGLPDFIQAAASPAVRAMHGTPPRDELPAASVPSGRVAAPRVPLASLAELSLERTVLRAAEPFTLTMTIDLAGPAVGADRLAYSAVVVAKPMASGQKQTVAQADGLFAPRSPTISIDAAGLPAGAYRLDAAVSLREPGGGPLGLATMAEGLIGHILPG